MDARYPSTQFFAEKWTFISTYGCAITHFSVASRIIARQLRINSLQNRNCLAESAMHFSLVRNGRKVSVDSVFCRKTDIYFYLQYGCAITHFSVASRIIAPQLRINSLQNHNCLMDSVTSFPLVRNGRKVSVDSVFCRKMDI